MLTTTLRTLEDHKLVNCKMYPKIPLRAEYSLMALGQSLITVICAEIMNLGSFRLSINP